MSALAAIYNVPADYPTWSSWAFAHMAHHRDINRTLHDLLNLTLDEFPLDPFNPHDAANWSYQHQLMHNQMDAVLGISGYNLLSPVFNDPSQRAGWIALNADEHRQASNILGIG